MTPEPHIGHNSVSADRLRSFVQRIQRLEEDKAAVAEDIKEVYAEAKSTGWDTKTIRSVIRILKMDEQKRAEQEELLELYLGCLEGTPLGEAAKRARASS